jgi:MurNAc alpha-1-phosphate uridylyltransferase
MHAMILAAGRGERMAELTRNVPKSLLKVGDHYLIEYSIFSLIKIGVKKIVINVCYLGDQIKHALGNGERYGVEIIYSDESTALETGGGIFQALPLLGTDPFIVLSADIVSAYSLQKLPKEPEGLAHLVLVDNPIFHPHGDFCLDGNRIFTQEQNDYTFGNIGIYRHELFADCEAGYFRLGDLLKKHIPDNTITGEYFSGFWRNIGTPDQLLLLNQQFETGKATI